MKQVSSASQITILVEKNWKIREDVFSHEWQIEYEIKNEY
jgi:hypothetical protein